MLRVSDGSPADCVQVESGVDRSDGVDAVIGACACPDYQRRLVACKHVWALKLLAAITRVAASPVLAVAS